MNGAVTYDGNAHCWITGNVLGLHELGHTLIGGDRRDGSKTVFGDPGPNVEGMNIIRRELGADYGTRLSYVASSIGRDSTTFYLPFGIGSYLSMYDNKTPKHHVIVLH